MIQIEVQVNIKGSVKVKLMLEEMFKKMLVVDVKEILS